MAGVKPDIHGEQFSDAPDHQAGSGEEHKDHGHLPDDERARKQGRFSGSGNGRGVVLGTGSDPGPASQPGWRHAENNSGGEGDEACQGQRPAVQLNGAEAEEFRAHGAGDQFQPVPSDEKTGGSPQNGEKEAFTEQLAEQARPARAQSGTDRELLLARPDPGELEVGKVGGDNQQDEDRGDGQGPERSFYFGKGETVEEALGDEVELGLGAICESLPGLNHAQEGGRLLFIDIVSDFRDHAGVGQGFGSYAQGCVHHLARHGVRPQPWAPEAGLARVHEMRGHDSYDRRAGFLEADSFSDDGRVAPE